MTHPVSLHDQILAYVQSDAYTTFVDGAVSYQILANEFESFWRAIIAQELNSNLSAIEHEENFKLPAPFKRKIILSIWSVNDGLK
jgi:hypothetical protein